MSDNDNEEQKRRLRLEISDLEYSVKGLNKRIVDSTQELETYRLEQQNCIRKLKAQQDQRAQLFNKLSMQQKVCRLLDAEVLKLEQKSRDIVDEETGGREIATDLPADDHVTKEEQDVKTNDNSDDSNLFEDLIQLEPWPDHKTLEEMWTKNPHRFSINFVHPARVTDYLLMSWREVLSCPKDDEALFRRECLWRTPLDVRLLLGDEEDVDSVIRKPQPRRPMLDPNISMCPYELQGECADLECSYQHLKPRAKIPRELIALPRLKLKKKRKLPRKAAPRDEGKPLKLQDNFSMDEDFVRLPENDTLRTTAGKEDEYLFEWLKPVLNGDSIYHLLGVTLKHDPKSGMSYVHMDPGDCIHLFVSHQWAIHSGRHDLATSFLDTYNELYCVDEYSRFLEIQQKTLFTNNKKDCFSRLFDAQLYITLTYTLKQHELRHGGSTELKALVGKMVAQCYSGGRRSRRTEISVESISDRISAELEKTSRDSPVGYDSLQSLIQKCESASFLRADIRCVSSLGDVIGVFLPLAEMALGAPSCVHQKGDFVETWPLLNAVPVFAQTMFGSIACVARHVDENSSGNAELQSLPLRIHKMLCAFRRRFHDIYQTDFLMAPLFAANIALACTIRLYDKTYTWLEDLLQDSSPIDSKVSRFFSGTLMPYSDMLWSQLIQLRSALPKKLHTSSLIIASNESLPTELIEESKAIEVALEKVCPSHVVMRNDIAITKYIRAADSVVSGEMMSNFHHMHHYLQRRSAPTSNFLDADRIELSLKGQQLLGIECYKPASSLRYAIPQSILLCGHILKSLDLSETGLEQLHPTFGTYFPNLKRCDLSRNKLSSLPNSIGRLSSLQYFFIDYNSLTCLPQFRLDHLLHLSAVSNKLNSIPETISDCIELTTVDFSDNQLNVSDFILIISKLPNLTSFKPEKNPSKRLSIADNHLQIKKARVE